MNKLVTKQDIESQQAMTISAWLERPEVEERIGNALAGWMSPKSFVSSLLISFQAPSARELLSQEPVRSGP